MMEFEGESCDPLKSLMRMLKSRMPDYEPHCPIPPDVLKEWNELLVEINKAQSATKVAEAKKTYSGHHWKIGLEFTTRA